jgi:hypothetical protein
MDSTMPNSTRHNAQRRFTHHWSGAAARTASLAVTIMLAGCGGGGGGAGGASGGPASMSRAVSAFDSQQYDAAHNQAAAIMNKSTGVQREEAAYIAGLSSYQMGNHSAADGELSVAAVSSDPQTAGSAKAMLGQLRLDQRRPREAASCFADASRLLEGEDARKAAWHAGVAYRQAGDEASAKRWLDTASSAQFDSSSGALDGQTAVASASPASQRTNSSSSASSSARPTSVMGSSSKPGSSGDSANANANASGVAQSASVGFTLQVGAFNDRVRARKAAEEADALSKSQSLGRVRVIPRRDAHGQPMYLVQVGWWVTRAEAAQARAKVGKLEYIVAPAAPLT